MNKLLVIPPLIISGLLAIAMFISEDWTLGIIFLLIAVAPIIIMKIMSRPRQEEELYTKINKALESVPDDMDYGNLILTGIKPAKYLYTDKEQEESKIQITDKEGNKEIKKVKKEENPQIEILQDVQRKIKYPPQAIQPAKNIGQIIKKVSIETQQKVGDYEEEKVLHVFKIYKKTGLLSSKTFWLYVYHDELINPIMEGENVVVEGIDIFPLTDKHYVTSTSPGRKMMELVTGLGILGSAETLLDHLGRITKETLKSNMEHQRRMQLGGQVLKIGKKGIQTARKGYGDMKRSAEGSQRDQPLDQQLR